MIPLPRTIFFLSNLGHWVTADGETKKKSILQLVRSDTSLRVNTWKKGQTYLFTDKLKSSFDKIDMEMNKH